MSDVKRYVVRGRHHSMWITYDCPTAESALKKLQDFRDAEYADIVVTTPDGQVVAEADLGVLGEGKPVGGAPVDVDAPNALALVAYA